MKKVIWGSISLVVILAAVILIGPGLIDWNTYKSEISSQVKKQTGRDLTIGGDIRITVLPAPAIVANDVTLSNLSGASAEHMVSLKSAEVRIAFAPLLGGQVKVETVKLIEPVVQLEVLKDGRKNWDIQLAGTAAPAPAPSSSIAATNETGHTVSQGPSIVLDNFTIDNGTFIYLDKSTGVEEQVSGLNAEIAAASLQGPFQVSGGMTVRDVPVTFDVNVGELIQGRTLTLNVNTGIAPDLANLKINGTVLGLPEDPRFKGSFKGDGNNLLAVLNAVGLVDVPDLLAQQFSLEGDLNGSAIGGEVSELKVSLADSRIAGDVAVDIGSKTEFSVRLNAAQFDIDRWLLAQEIVPSEQSNGAVRTSDRATDVQRHASEADIAAVPVQFEIPADISGAVILSIDALKYNNGLVRDVLLNVDVAEGQVVLSQLSAGFPGGSEASLFGTLIADQGKPSFNGELEATVNDLRGVLDWLGTDIAAVPQDRLRKLNLNTKLSVTDEVAEITDLNFRFDSSHLTGAATFALRKRPSFGANIQLDRINLDAYLPKPSNPNVSPTSPADSGPVNGNATSENGENKVAEKPQSPFAGLSALGSFDANIRAQLKSVVFNGEKIQDAELDATLFNGDLDIRQLSVGSLAGVSASITGSLNDLTGLPKANNLNIRSATKNLAPILKLTGVDLGLDPRDLGAFSMASTINGNLLKPSLASTVKVAGASLKMDGVVSVLPISEMFDMKVSAKHKSLEKLARMFGSAYKPSGQIGGLDISAQLSGNPKAININQLSGKIGAIPVAGAINIVNSGAKPRINVDLDTGAIDISPYLPAEQNAYLKRNEWGQLFVRPVAWMRSLETPSRSGFRPAAMRGRWSADPIDLSTLNLLDANISLNTPAIVFGKYLVEKADVDATLVDGTLKAHTITGVVFGGTVNASLTASHGQSNSVGARISADGVDIADALRSITGEESADGKLSVNLDINAAGRSVADFIATSSGTGAFNMVDVDVSKQTKGSVFAGVYGLISALNQFGASKKSQLADVGGTFVVNSGVASTNNLKLSSGLANGVAGGIVDLPNWNLDIKGQLELIQSALSNLIQSKLTGGKSQVPFSVVGSLDQPKVNVDMGAAMGSTLPIPGADLLLNKAPKGIGNILQGVIGGGQKPPSAPPTTNTDDTPPPPRNSEQQPTQQQVINPKKLLESLFK